MSDCPTCIPAPCGLANDLDLYNLSGPAYPFVLNCPPGSTCNARKVEIPCGDDVVTVDIPTGATPEERRAIILEALTACIPRRIFDDPRPIDPDSPPILLYGSRETSCTVYCSSTVMVVDGAPVVTNTGAFTYRFAAGAVLGYTQAEADFNANRLVCVRAKQHLVCLSAIQKAFCIGEGFEATIKARGQFVSQFPSTDYWEISGTLPPGLTFHGGFLSGGKAVIDGTPTTAGLYTFTVKITLGSRFGQGDYMERTYTMAIVEIHPDSVLPSLAIGSGYLQSLTLTPTHDQETEAWSVVGGALPPGIELTREGVLTGTPTQIGEYPFTASVTAIVNETSITCEKDFTFGYDMPLNQATYDSSRDVIWGVRAGRIFKCNATTGAKISETVIAFPDLGDSWVTYEPVNDRLLISHCFPNRNSDNIPVGDARILLVNPSTGLVITSGVAVSTALEFDTWATVFAFSGKLYALYNSVGSEASVLHRISVPGLTDEASRNITGIEGRYGDVAVDVGGGVVYVLSSLSDNITAINLPGLTLVGVDPDMGPSEYQSGIALAGGFLWTVGGTQIVTKVPTDGSPATQIDTGLTTIKPWRIKYFPVNGRLLIPGWESNTVVSMNPGTGAVDHVYTGFDGAFDIVTTPSHAFAVQTGGQGLKLIV